MNQNLEDFITEFPVVQEIADLLAKKNQDYNSSIKRDEYFPFGQVSYTQMLHIKTLRLRSLTENKDAPNFESIEDTLIDLICYALFNLNAIKGEDK